ncbi:MAG: ATP-binding protein [Chloroflexi bacterium]|nr:ATP-binding protein [Chloroflexota bacterium]
MSRRVRPSAAATRRQTKALAASVPDVVATLRAEIAPPEPPHGTPALLLMMGFPGVGKSHCARLLAARLRAAHVASDHLRSRLFVAASYAQEENTAVFRIIDGLVERLVDEGHRVIVDATHLRRAARASTAGIARRRGVPLAHILVVADEAETLARLAERRRARAPDDRSDADERIFYGMRSRGFEEPDDPYLTIRNGPGLEAEIEHVVADLGVRWSAAT